jgi:DNA-binding HxlR family transcriptional regulator
MKLSETGEAFLAEARRRILWALDTRGPLSAGELPRGWPVTRVVTRHLVEELLADGEVERTDEGRVPGRTDLRITARGRSRLRGTDGAGV